MKPVGKPESGDPHVRFDEQERGNGTVVAVTAPLLDFY